MSGIKICGLSRLEDIVAVNAVMPDYVGFVFAKSRRQVSAQKGAQLKERLDPRIGAVGVFVNEDRAFIKKLCRERVIDLVQLHGDEDEAYIKDLKRHIFCPIIKAVRVRDRADGLRAQESCCDFLLFDTYAENQYGGTGKAFDWSLLQDLEKPFFLAGGIGSHNAAEAIRMVQPYCVDASSSVETQGLKDPQKIAELVKEIRSVR